MTELAAITALLKTSTAVVSALKAFSTSNSHKPYDFESLRQALASHHQQVMNRCETTSFGTLESQPLLDIYVPLDVISPKRERSQEEQREDASEVLARENHIVLLGQPGAGKSTTVQHTCISMLRGNWPETRCPIVIRLRDLKSTNPNDPILLDQLESIFEFHLEPNKNHSGKTTTELKLKAIAQLLDSINATLVLDGLDELSSYADRDSVTQSIRDLSSYLINAQIVLTSRPGDYHEHIDSFRVIEVAPMTEKQISVFAQKQLKDQAQSFEEQVKDTTYYGTTMRPLVLANLCAIFIETKQIPNRPVDVYSKIVDLLVEKWDQNRSISRATRYTNYATFATFTKIKFLSALAYQLTIDVGGASFSKRQVQAAYEKIYANFDLKIENAAGVIDELESHTGLIIKVGSDDIEFAHKSLQEYLCATHLVSLVSLPPIKNLKTLPNELALAIVMSGNSQDYFMNVIQTRAHAKTVPIEFYFTFSDRLAVEKVSLTDSPETAFALLSLVKSHATPHFAVLIAKHMRWQWFNLYYTETVTSSTAIYATNGTNFKGLSRKIFDNLPKKMLIMRHLNKVVVLSGHA